MHCNAFLHIGVCVCVGVCACACARACVCMCMHVCMHLSILMFVPMQLNAFKVLKMREMLEVSTSAYLIAFNNMTSRVERGQYYLLVLYAMCFVRYINVRLPFLLHSAIFLDSSVIDPYILQ